MGEVTKYSNQGRNENLSQAFDTEERPDKLFSGII